MPKHRVGAIANEFVKRAQQEKREITNMQLQKLPYLAHGWGLALLDEELIDEVPTTAPYGPVYRRLYSALRHYGAGTVTDFIHENDGAGGIFFGGPRGEALFENLSDIETQLIDIVWSTYKNYTVLQLSAHTHQDDSPWTIVMEDKGPGQDIPNETIKRYFKSLAERRRADIAA